MIDIESYDKIEVDLEKSACWCEFSDDDYGCNLGNTVCDGFDKPPNDCPLRKRPVLVIAKGE